MNRRGLLINLCILTIFIGSGCAHWGTEKRTQPAEEVARKPLGEPRLRQETSVNLGGLLTTDSVRGRSGSSSSTGFGGGFGSVQESICIQQAEVSYRQAFEIVPVVQDREWDVAGGVLLIVAGIGLSVAAVIAEEPGVFAPGDPLYEPPPDMTAAYAAGGLFILGGAGWIIGSYAGLPSGQPPQVVSGVDEFTRVQFVEAMGCLQPTPAPVPAPSQPKPDSVLVQTPQQRLEQLERLKSEGLISTREYNEKRRKILDEL